MLKKFFNSLVSGFEKLTIDLCERGLSDYGIDVHNLGGKND